MTRVRDIWSKYIYTVKELINGAFNNEAQKDKLDKSNYSHLPALKLGRITATTKIRSKSKGCLKNGDMFQCKYQLVNRITIMNLLFSFEAGSNIFRILCDFILLLISKVIWSNYMIGRILEKVLDPSVLTFPEDDFEHLKVSKNFLLAWDICYIYI